MADKTPAQKLLIKAGSRLLLVQPPENVETLLGGFPQDVMLLESKAESAEIILFFAADRKSLEMSLSGLKMALKPGGMIWVIYFKGTAKTKTDIHRDSINAYANTLGLQGVAMISINDDLSALRLKAV